MRILHTADWHLGRVFHRVDLLSEQRDALEQLVAYATRYQPNLVIVAGDIYDRPVPPAGAVCLLDEVLAQLVVELAIPTVVIAGNHDSADRLGFASRVLHEGRLHLFGRQKHPRGLRLEDEHGPLWLYALPYADPVYVRELLSDDAIKTHQQATSALVGEIWRQHAAYEGERAILVAHLDVEGGKLSDSERTLSAFRPQAVAQQTLSGFSYVALGHLHRPQQVGEQPIRYAGSLLPFSFSEANDDKSFALVTIDADGQSSVELLPIELPRGVRVVSGTLREVIAAATEDEQREDYLKVTLLDRGPVIEAMARLREVYPNVLQVDRPNAVDPDESPPNDPSEKAARLSKKEQFETFFEQVVGEPLDELEQAELQRVIERLDRS
jgi:exonuclease SbcD